MAKKVKTHKIKKILIANRGEIACRVMKTARKMGITTVAVYSDADRKALHVRMADEAVHIGPSPAVESYLVIEKIIAAAKETGADAVHPGYGFLSENPDFVRACEKAKITFIGPSAESMEAMGLKDAAKKLMDKAGVPITPGYHGKDQSPKLLKAKAGMIGYPVLIKAVAGGGGKGMRKVETEEDFEAMLASCQREAKSSFNNDDVLIEKYIQSPRHIEVQIFGDTHGNVVHMFERDCSLQRRHQKVIEEAPAPGMTKAVRKAMTDAAIEAAKAVNYVGAGTVEFIVDGSGKLKKDGFWFMEMNTRLQVEHPVTEMITGLDLVELQIRVAQGEKLPKQKDIKMEGHAVEARLYAENPANDFLPSVGKLEQLFVSDYAENDCLMRIDTGVETGDVISVFYDPMIAKIISYGPNRAEAIETLDYPLARCEILGITSNADFLLQLISNSSFKNFKIDTSFIAKNIETLIPKNLSYSPRGIALATVKLLQNGLSQERRLIRNNIKSLSPWLDRTCWRLNQSGSFTANFFDGDKTHIGKVVQINFDSWTVNVGNENVIVRKNRNENFELDKDIGYLHSWRSNISNGQVILSGDGATLTLNLLKVDNIDGISGNALTAPMPGKIIAVNAEAGDTVSAGDPLIIMEAMKMEMTLEAPRDGVVAEVTAAIDALVTDGEMLLSLEEIET